MSGALSHNRVVEKFRALKARGEVALVPYVTAGDPHIDETVELVAELARGGADVVELGVPWSDPSADGVVIQRAMERALDQGGIGHDTIARTLDAVRAIRQRTDVPLILFGYFNPLLQRGLARVAQEARDAGVDGLLVVDLPPEESSELDAELASRSLARVPLLAPTTSLARAASIAAHGSGFAYYVALTGVTGAGTLDAAAVETRVKALRPALGALPLAVGFGIKDPAGARAIARFADGVVVGSALVQAIADAPTAAARREVAHQMMRALKDAIAR